MEIFDLSRMNFKFKFTNVNVSNTAFCDSKLDNIHSVLINKYLKNGEGLTPKREDPFLQIGEGE